MVLHRIPEQVDARNLSLMVRWGSSLGQKTPLSFLVTDWLLDTRSPSGQAASSSFGALFTFGAPALRACQRSYAACCATHRSARPPRLTPSQPSSRSAMAGEIAARSFRTRESAARVTPNCAAASVQKGRVPGGRLRGALLRGGAGCACGSCHGVLSVVVEVIHQHGIFAVELEGHAPVAVDGDCKAAEWLAQQ